MIRLTILAATIFLAIANTATAQYFSDITAAYDQHVRQQNAQFQMMEQQMTQQNMQNPQVQMMYQQYLQQGGQGSLEQFALGYAETGGYTPQGINYFRNATRQIQQQDADAVRNYHNYVNNLWSQTGDYRRQVNDQIAYYRGENLSGNGTYYAPNTAYQYQLPYTSPAGTVHYDNANGNSYYMDAMGTYWISNGNGYWYPMNRQ